MFSSPVNLTLVCQPHAVAGGWLAGTVYADIRSECNATMLKLEINGACVLRISDQAAVSLSPCLHSL